MAHKCRRCITDYLANGKDDTGHNGASLMGTLIHEGFIPYYEKIIGMRIVDREKEIENDFFTGHIDGYIKKTKTVFELKTVSTFIFAKLEEPKIEHVQQVHVYMSIMGVKSAHIVYVDRDMGNHKAFTIQYNPLIYRALEQKARECIEDARAGRYGYDVHLDAFETCDAYCDFQTPKPIEVLPDGEVLIESLSEDERREVIELVQEYQELNAQEKDAKANKSHISERVKEILLAHNAKKISDLKLSIVQQQRAAIDADALKKDHPDIFEKYQKVNVSQFVKFPTAV